MALEGDLPGLFQRAFHRLDLAQDVHAVRVMLLQGLQDAFQMPLGDGEPARDHFARNLRHAQAAADLVREMRVGLFGAHTASSTWAL